MNSLRSIILILIMVSVCLPGRAADRITATIAVTNAPLGNTNTLTINGNVRTFTNSVTASPGTLVQQTNSVPWSATNLINQLTDYRVSQFHFLGQSASNNVRITGTVGEALTVSLAGLWGTITYSTQNVTIANVVRVPMSVEYDTNRAWIASLTVLGLSDYATNGFATNAAALANYVSKGASALQNITAPIQFNALLGSAISSLTNANLFNATNRGYVVAFTNGYWTNAVLDSATITNVNLPGSGLTSVEINGTASGDFSSAIGGTASGYSSTAIGVGSTASAHGAVSLGTTAAATATNALALGTDASAQANNSIALGASAGVADADSVAIGTGALSTTTNQIVLGSSSYTVEIPGVLNVSGTITNPVTAGTNRLAGQLVFVPASNTGLANGYNAGIAINSAYVKFSGPSAAYTNAGFSAANKMDGKMHFCQFDNPGLSMTLLHDSGLDAGNSTNRIYTGTGALLNSTNRTVHVIMSYDDASTAWRIWSFR